MARPPTWLGWTIACLLTSACTRTAASEAKLSDGVAEVCARGETMLLRELPDGRFALMQATLDSAHLASTLHNLLPPRPGPRVIMVSLGPDRARHEAWIARAIETEGWTAYKPDSICLTAGARPWFLNGIARRQSRIPIHHLYPVSLSEIRNPRSAKSPRSFERGLFVVADLYRGGAAL